jgi:hypothetical protein
MLKAYRLSNRTEQIRIEIKTKTSTDLMRGKMKDLKNRNSTSPPYEIRS